MHEVDQELFELVGVRRDAGGDRCRQDHVKFPPHHRNPVVGGVEQLQPRLLRRPPFVRFS